MAGVPEDHADGARALLEIQAKCREWGEILRRNGWDSDKMAAANRPEAKDAELAVMALIKKHRARLSYCEDQFGRDPSNSLRQAFHYIDIHLTRGPEALAHTTGLPECLTVEVAQPNVPEPYREPTFIVQLGRWAQSLADEAAKEESPGIPGSPKAREGDSGGAGMPSPEDVQFFQQIAEHIKGDPDGYREAGEWLDREYGNEAFWRRHRRELRELIGKEKAGTLAAGGREGLKKIRSWPRGSPERKRRTFLELRRFTAATKLYFDDLPAFTTDTEARRILLMTWLMTDPDADKARLGLTEFEDWPWEVEEQDTHFASRRFASDWWRYPSEGYFKWRDLARRAWETVRGRQLKQRRGRWPSRRTEREVDKYLSERGEQYNRFVPLVLAGDPKATKLFQQTFGPTAIARALGDGCQKQNVQKTQTYQEKIQPLFRKPPRPREGWTLPAQDGSELGDTIAEMHKRAKGGA